MKEPTSSEEYWAQVRIKQRILFTALALLIPLCCVIAAIILVVTGQ